MKKKTETDNYKHCNHHHELTPDQELIDLGTGEFVADKQRIPLLKALNECGLTTTTHCYGPNTGYSFIGISMDNIDSIEVRTGDRGKRKELIIIWKRSD